MYDKECDRSLRINTVGTREWLHQSSHYNRYEATPYKALDDFFQVYNLNNMDSVVDFGCGKGRLPFYIHNRFDVSVTGIEMSGQLYTEALENKNSYSKKIKRMNAFIRFDCCLAEEYEIEAENNRFYFFNPFSIQIFRKVIDNILLSVEKHPRSVEIILYYPTSDYIEFLEMSTPFELIKGVKVSSMYEKDPNELFLVFRFGS